MLLVLVVFDIMFNGANTIVMFNSVVNIYSVSILNIIGGMSLLLLVVLLLSIMVLWSLLLLLLVILSLYFVWCH